jgi:anti-anti-sigma regulatory factor
MLLDLVGRTAKKVAVFCYDITERKKYEEQLKAQAKAIEELSTPVIQLWDGILALPLIGTIDSTRAKQIMENLLSEIVNSKSSQVVIDITGVPIVDTGVASRLMRTVEAARLLGAECILTGISPVIAQTLVTVGVNLGNIKTQGTLKNGLESALKNLNMQVFENGSGNIK